MKLSKWIMILMLTGCTITPKAPDFPKKWHPINELADQPVAIALNQQHIYRVTRLDTTVKELITRWGEEAKMPVVYDHTHDFTLFKSVLNIQSYDLNVALKQLSDWYVNQNIIFYIKDNVIVVHKKEDNRLNQFTNESK